MLLAFSCQVGMRAKGNFMGDQMIRSLSSVSRHQIAWQSAWHRCTSNISNKDHVTLEPHNQARVRYYHGPSGIYKPYHPLLFSSTTKQTMANDFRFVPGHKTGYENIILLNFRYTREKKIDNKTYWKCCFYRNGCRARLVTEDHQLILDIQLTTATSSSRC